MCAKGFFLSHNCQWSFCFFYPYRHIHVWDFNFDLKVKVIETDVFGHLLLQSSSTPFQATRCLRLSSANLSSLFHCSPCSHPCISQPEHLPPVDPSLCGSSLLFVLCGQSFGFIQFLFLLNFKNQLFASVFFIFFTIEVTHESSLLFHSKH